jgi:hypothetical protein
MDNTARRIGWKCLKEPHGLTCNTCDCHEVVLGLLGSLKHCLQNFLLMSSVERLDNAMLRKEMAKACEKTRVESILKMGTNADGILPLAQEWSRSTYELLIISLDGA